MPERQDPMTREEVERALYQFDRSTQAIVSLLIEVSDRLDTLVEQNKKIIEQNNEIIGQIKK